MAILEVTLRQAYFGQEVINRFHYVSSGTPGAVSLSFALLSAMGFIYASTPPTSSSGLLFGFLRSMQSDELDYIEVEAKNLYSVTDFYTRPWVTPTSGVVGNEPQSPVLAYGFNTNRVVSNIRRGQRRFCGVDDSTVGEGGALVGSWLTYLATVAESMSDVLEYDDEGNTITFSPAVLSFEKYTTPGGNPAYRPYPTEAEQLTHAALGILWSPKPQARSQVSRQYGRGR